MKQIYALVTGSIVNVEKGLVNHLDCRVFYTLEEAKEAETKLRDTCHSTLIRAYGVKVEDLEDANL